MVRRHAVQVLGRLALRGVVVFALIVGLLGAGGLVQVASAGAVTTGNLTWSPPAAIDRSEGFLVSVSCPSASFCVAVNGYSNAFTWNGTSWSKPDLIDPNNTLVSVSCPSASFCVVMDGYGNAVTWNGTSWSAPESIDPASDGVGGLTSVSCPSASFCVAADEAGNALVARALRGYDILTSNGGVTSFDAPWHGSPKAAGAPGPFTGIGAAPGGYDVVRANGGVLSYGTAWHGSLAGKLPAGVTAIGIAEA